MKFFLRLNIRLLWNLWEHDKKLGILKKIELELSSDLGCMDACIEYIIECSSFLVLDVMVIIKCSDSYAFS